MSKTQYIILLAVVVLAIIAAAFTVNSCNKPAITDNSQIEQLIKQHLSRADSLQKIALDSMLAISKRDSIHNYTINNIFNNATKTKKEIINKPFNSNYVSGIRNLLDSVYRANNR